MSKRTAMFTMVLSALTLLAGPASPQPIVQDTPVIDIERAVRLEREANDLLVNLRDLGGAARRLRKAASLRPASDPIALTDLSTSARVSYYRKDLSQARSTMREAAERALAMGDVMQAADFFVDIAHLSVALKDGLAAKSALERARLLSASPLLSAVQQARLAARISPAPTVVAGREEGGRR